jgi:hypothetical protein
MTEPQFTIFCLRCREFLPDAAFRSRARGQKYNCSVCRSCERAGGQTGIPSSSDTRPRLLDLIRFFNSIRISTTHFYKGTPCWEWTAQIVRGGYGSFSLRRQSRAAHNVGFLWFVGDIDQSLERDHLCRNRPCVNPLHIEQVTRQINCIRGEGACADHARQTHCIRGHELTPSNILQFQSDSRRRCKTCHRDRERARRANGHY